MRAAPWPLTSTSVWVIMRPGPIPRSRHERVRGCRSCQVGRASRPLPAPASCGAGGLCVYSHKCRNMCIPSPDRAVTSRRRCLSWGLFGALPPAGSFTQTWGRHPQDESGSHMGFLLHPPRRLCKIRTTSAASHIRVRTRVCSLSLPIEGTPLTQRACLALKNWHRALL